MDCGNCLNLLEDGLCAVYGKEPPPGFAARCRHCMPNPDAIPLAESESAGTSGGPTTARARLCLDGHCPFLVKGLPPGDYCRKRVLTDRTEYLLLGEETSCPRLWTT